MKQSQEKNPLSGFHASVLMSANSQVAPPLVDRAWNVRIRLSARFLRLSYQMACAFPDSSTARNAHAIWYDNRKNLADKRIRTYQMACAFPDSSTASHGKN